MLLILFNFLLMLSHINAEWEISEEFYPPKKLFERIGGYASFLKFGATPTNQIQNAVQVFLTESLETKYSGILISNDANLITSNGCMLPFSSKKECYRLSETQKVQRFEKVKKEDECHFINSTFLQLNIPNSEGYCSNNQLYNAKLGTNTTILCKYPCSNISKLEFLNQQISTNQLCNCEKCATVINPRATLNSSNHLQIDIFLQPSFYATINFTDVKAISSSSSNDINDNRKDCPSFVSTTVDYFNANNTNTNIARFWLKRGRFYCPSEITCPWEIFYVFYEDDPFFRPSYLFTAKVVILGIHVAIAEKALTFYTNKLW